MTKAVYDTRAAKKAVTLSLNEDLVGQARRLTNNLSAEVEALLAEFVARHADVHETEAELLRRSATAWNEYDERHGSFADEFSTL